MRRALLISIGLVVVIAALGWRQGRELEALRAEPEAARARVGLAELPRGGARPIRRPRPDGAAEARRVAADFISYAIEMSALGYKATENPEGELRRRIISQMEAVTNLDSRQLGVLIEEVVVSSEPSDSLKGTLLYWALPRLIQSRPSEALALITPEVRRLISTTATGGVHQQMLRDALVRLSDDDPDAALAWYRKNRDELEPDLRQSAEAALVIPLSKVDLTAALRLVDELGLDRDVFVPWLARTAGEAPEQRMLAVETLREWRRDDPEDRRDQFKSVLGTILFGSGAESAGFEEAVGRLEQLNLSADELELVVFPEISQFSYRFEQGEAGLWADWLVNESPHEAGRDWVSEFYTRWKTKNPKAAEAWLKDSADGPVRHTD